MTVQRPGWNEVPLGSILSYLDERVALQDEKEYLTITVKRRHGGLEIRERLFGHQIATKKQFRLVPGAFIISRVQCWHQAYAIVRDVPPNTIASINYDQFAISPAVDAQFFWWLSYSHDFTETVRSSAFGVVIEKMVFDRDAWLTKTVWLPPLKEQQRIVVRIEELATQIREAKALRKQAAEDAEALVSSASALFFEPKAGWKTMAVGDFCEPPQYGYTESATDQPVGPRFLRITDIQNGNVDWGRVPFCRCPEPDKYLLKPGDLVFARTGATTGKSFVIRDCPEAVFASYLIRLRVRDTVLVDYLYRYFQSPAYWIQIADEKKGTGQPNLNGSKLGRLKVPVPPLPEQRRIVAELDALQVEVDKLRRLQAETAAELDALLPSILDKAFKGEL